MRILVAGSRTRNLPEDFTKRTFNNMMNNVLKMYENEKIEMCFGDANGIDKMAEEFAYAHRIPSKKFVAQWKDEFGNTRKGAGFERNRWMFDWLKEVPTDQTLVVLFWDMESPGTKDDLIQAHDNGMNKFIYNVNENRWLRRDEIKEATAHAKLHQFDWKNKKEQAQTAEYDNIAPISAVPTINPPDITSTDDIGLPAINNNNIDLPGIEEFLKKDNNIPSQEKPTETTTSVKTVATTKPTTESPKKPVPGMGMIAKNVTETTEVQNKEVKPATVKQPVTEPKPEGETIVMAPGKKPIPITETETPVQETDTPVSETTKKEVTEPVTKEPSETKSEKNISLTIKRNGNTKIIKIPDLEDSDEDIEITIDI